MKLIEKLKEDDIIKRVGKTLYIKEGVRFLHNEEVEIDDDFLNNKMSNNVYLDELTEEDLLY